MQFVGIDVSAKTLAVHLQLSQGTRQRFTVDNTRAGHQKLCRRLTQSGDPTQVALEATGLYSLDIALALVSQPAVALMVVNPRSLRDFARADLRRSKTDALDAEVLLDYCQRMRFQPWQPPSPQALELRAISRRIADLTDLLTQERNRLHAVSVVSSLGCVVLQDLEDHLRHLEGRIEALQQEAWRRIQGQADLQQNAQLLLSTPGIARKSAIHLLAELSVLPVGQDGPATRFIGRRKSAGRTGAASRSVSLSINPPTLPPADPRLFRDRPLACGRFQPCLRMGGDARPWSAPRCWSRFNPRLRAGGDVGHEDLLSSDRCFNLRLCVGGDHDGHAGVDVEVVSIHASAREATGPDGHPRPGGEVSIHTSAREATLLTQTEPR